MNIAHIVLAIIDVLVFVALFAAFQYAIAKSSIWVMNYEISAEGINVVLIGGRFIIKRINRSRIMNATIVNGFITSLRHPFVVSMRNRIFGPALLLKIDGQSDLLISPDNPEEALQTLGFGES